MRGRASQMAVALIVAAGSGSRLGADRPKALVEIAGRPMLDWSLAALRASDRVGQIVVALPAGVAPPDGVAAVTGGTSRSASVRAALAAAPAGEELVLVHDAARPLLTPELADAVIDALLADEQAVGAIAAAPVADTVKRVEGRYVSETLRREELWAVQTPQVFRRAPLERALAGASEQQLAAATDDSQLIERAGGRIVVLPWLEANGKVTTPADLAAVERILATRS